VKYVKPEKPERPEKPKQPWSCEVETFRRAEWAEGDQQTGSQVLPVPQQSFPLRSSSVWARMQKFVSQKREEKPSIKSVDKQRPQSSSARKRLSLRMQ